MFPSDAEHRIEAVDLAIDGLLELDASSLDQESLARWTIAMHRLQQRMDAAVTSATGAFDRHGDPQGAIGSAPWLAWRCRIPKAQAKAELARSRALRSMPATASAYESGAVSSQHVRVLAAAQRAAPEAFEAKEHELVADAMDLRFDAFQRRMAYFRLEHDQSGEDRRAADAFDRRALFGARTFEDTVDVRATLDPVGGTIWLEELQRIERMLFEDDWRDARQRLGDAATARDLRRSTGQRFADAQVEMARRSAAMAPGAKQARPLFTVHVGFETFHGMLSQLADGTVVTGTQLLPHLTDADVERIVFDGPSRVLDVGVRQRCFTGATRRAVEARDLCCTHESCDVPYTQCDIDHSQPYATGGETVQGNGRVRCPHHNPGRRRPCQPPPPDD